MERPQQRSRPIPVTVRLAIVLALALASLTSCGESEGANPAPHPDITAADSAVRLVEMSKADLILYASNQSFDDEEVRLTIVVDGATVVDDDFQVADQHNWASFPLALSPGEHEVTAGTDSGATLHESFRLPNTGRRYAVIDHWGEDDSAELTWLFEREPIAFA